MNKIKNRPKLKNDPNIKRTQIQKWHKFKIDQKTKKIKKQKDKKQKVQINNDKKIELKKIKWQF